jgi:hypothetical protein
MALQKVVEDDDFVPRGDELCRRDAANVTRATCDQDIHGSKQ